MRLKLTLNSDLEYITLNIHHNYIVQSMLYKNLPKPLANFLHDIGFFYNKRQFKLFTFSKIQSEYFILIKKKGKVEKIKYKTPISICISSAISTIAKNWGETFIKKDNIFLEKNPLYIEKIEVIPTPNIKQELTIKTLSPITVYRTFENGKKYYRYYSPQEPEFQQLLKENLKKKYELITGKETPDLSFDIEEAKTRKILVKYKDFPVESYEGVLKVKTDPEIFKAVYDAGLGAKNSQGFGMIEVITES